MVYLPTLRQHAFIQLLYLPEDGGGVIVCYYLVIRNILVTSICYGKAFRWIYKKTLKPGSEDEACQQQGHFSSSNHFEGKLFKSLVNTPNS